MINECGEHHLPRQFNRKLYDVIESFQGKRATNTPLRLQDIHGKGDGVYIPSLEDHTLDFLIAQTSMPQDLLKDDYVPKKNANQGQQATTIGL
jgi:hypothetical protein